MLLLCVGSHEALLAFQYRFLICDLQPADTMDFHNARLGTTPCSACWVWAETTQPPRTTEQKGARKTTPENIFDRVNMCEAEHSGLESDECFCCVQRRRGWAFLKDRSLHVVAATSNDSQPLQLCPKESGSLTLFNQVRNLGGCSQFTVQTSLSFTLQARCLQPCHHRRTLLMKPLVSRITPCTELLEVEI